VSWVERAKVDPVAAQTVRNYHHRPREELYDLRYDPDEQNNLANDPAYAQTLESHRQLVQQWIKQSGDTLQMHGKPMEILFPLEP
jgi:N-sulfoglucosamine sulfohydrolase